ncbi:GrpB family protein [Listeria grandensis]|uniref:GrpB family protein n=1 Tax=Listeria grandensis TaxID=1494963 RepID=UPI003CC82CA0
MICESTRKKKCEYEELKSRLGEQFPDDIGGYSDGKDRFVKEIERLAILWYWQSR